MGASNRLDKSAIAVLIPICVYLRLSAVSKKAAVVARKG